MADPIETQNPPAAPAAGAPPPTQTTPPVAPAASGEVKDPATLLTEKLNLENEAKAKAETEAKAAAETKAKEEAAKKATEKAERQKNMTPEQKAADDAKEVAEAKAKEVPADGKYEYKLPEGFTVPEDIKGKLDGLLKDAKLTNGDAQRIVELGAELSKKATDGLHADIIKYRDEEDRKGVEAIQNHPTLGGAKFDESLAIAQRTLRTFGTPELIKLIESTRFGSRTPFFEFCYNIGQKIGETGGVQAATDTTPDTPEGRMFGAAVQNLSKNK